MDETIGRRGFMGHVGVTILAAFGLATMPIAAGAAGARTLQGPTVRCCVNNTSCPPSCGPGKVRYLCNPLVSGCGPSYCTACQTAHGTCYEYVGC